MRLSVFTLREPVPDLDTPHALTVLRPWVDVGNVGTLAVTALERAMDAQPLAQLTRPGVFFDFTRYRPTVYFKEERREIEVPNATVSVAPREGTNDLLFLHLLEPHMNGEDYVAAILQLFEKFSVKRYVLVGAMYDLVPHTMPLRISGSSSEPETQQALARYGVRTSRYEGPTSILTLLPVEAARRGIETMTMLVRLPQYAPLDEDYAGKLRLLEVLSDLYDIPVDLSDDRLKAEEQSRQITAAVEENPQLKRALERLERRYARSTVEPEEAPQPPPLPPSIERFLRELDP